MKSSLPKDIRHCLARLTLTLCMSSMLGACAVVQSPVEVDSQALLSQQHSTNAYAWVQSMHSIYCAWIACL